MPGIDSGVTGQRIRFGAGLRHGAGDEVRRLGCSRALVLSTPQQAGMAAEIAAALGPLAAGTFTGAAMHTPVSVTEDAQHAAERLNADCTIAVGGGSTTGLGKALSWRTGAPQIAIPTTYAGSEATPILGQTEDGRKTTMTDPRIRPQVILYDPELVTSLPAVTSVTSGLNAIAHAAEALYARDRADATSALAQDGLRAFASALPRVLADPQDVSARADTLRGAWACGAVLGLVGMALHHKLCHTLGGSFDLPHADTHAIVLPHAIAYNAAAVPDLLAPVTTILGGPSPGRALWDFAVGLGAPRALRDLGLAEADLDRAADLASQNPYWNPREITRDGIRKLLQTAWSGTAPP